MNVVIFGYGRMGKLVHKVLDERGIRIWGIAEPDGLKIPAGVTSPGGIKHVGEGDILHADTAICFTSPPESAYGITKAILGKGIDAIVGTTKWYLNPDKSVNQDMIAELDELAKQHDCRFVYAPNFSIGMNVFWQNLKQLAPVLAEHGYDVAVVEEHHSKKADAPSGTANTIGSILLEAYAGKKTALKTDFSTPIQPHEIGISVVRAGDIPGTHRVIFESAVDKFVLEHVVHDREIFAKGAVDTAYWAKEQKPGAYCITDRLK